MSFEASRNPNEPIGLYEATARGAGARSRLRALGVAVLVIASIFVTFAPPAAADGGEYKLDFTAAAPLTYDHSTGGGAFNDRTVVGGVGDIVESLEGGDFACGDTITYLTQIRRDGIFDPALVDQPETLELRYSFLADTTGRSGVAITEVLGAKINYGQIVGFDGTGSVDVIGDGLGGTDSGIVSGGFLLSVATLVPDGDGRLWTDNDIDPFNKGAEIYATVQVTNIDPGEFLVLRIDVLLGCDAARPTGNLQAQLNYTDVIASTTVDPTDFPDRVPGGEQTIPFKQIKKIYPVVCPEQDYIYLGQDPSCNVGLDTDPNAPPTPTSSDQQGEIPVVGNVVTQVVENPEISTMSMTGALLAFVAWRRRSGTGALTDLV